MDAHLLNSTGLRGKTTLGNHPKLKTALGISSRSLVHHWKKAGTPGQIPGYAAHVEAVSRAARYMQAGGYIGIGIGAMSTVLAVQRVCSEDSGEACKRVRFIEGGKLLGSTAAGVAGGRVSVWASAPICLALGLSTGVGGVVCVAAIVGTGVWAGAVVGGIEGEIGGEILYEATLP